MSALEAFARRIEERLKAVAHEPHWESGDAERYMAAVAGRREQFQQLSVRLLEAVIVPRVDALRRHFANASPTSDTPPGRYACWFGYCDRFPATTQVSFAVEHDVRFETVAVCYEAWMMPVFIKLNERDKLAAPLREVQEEAVAEWVEQRLLDFLDAYLRIDRGGDDFADEVATDPVCGMRISRAAAAATADYRGHPYYFCSDQCHERFTREPTAFVDAKAM